MQSIKKHLGILFCLLALSYCSPKIAWKPIQTPSFNIQAYQKIVVQADAISPKLLPALEEPFVQALQKLPISLQVSTTLPHAESIPFQKTKKSHSVVTEKFAILKIEYLQRDQLREIKDQVGKKSSWTKYFSSGIDFVENRPFQISFIDGQSQKILWSTFADVKCPTDDAESENNLANEFASSLVPGVIQTLQRNGLI